MVPRQHVPNATFPFPVAHLDGGSNPGVYDFDDQVIRLVKWQPSSHGLTASCSELAASRLGQLFEAPVVRGCVVYVDGPMLMPGVGGNGFHVGFTHLAGANFRDADYPSLKNKAALPAAAVQLAWLRVGDQEDHNQYLWNEERILPDGTTRKTFHLILVDQAKIFGQFDWSGAGPGGANDPYNLPAHLKAQLTMPAIEPVLAIVDAIAEDDILACFSNWPEVWGLDARLPEVATEYLVRRRRDHLADVLRANFA